MSGPVELHGAGRWSDPVGSRFCRTATDTVKRFNLAATEFERSIAGVDAFHENDINYESQKEKIYGMKVEFHG